MADDSTDSAFGFILFILFLALLGYAAGGGGGVSPAPVTPAPVTPAPVTPAPVTPAPVTPAPVTPAPGGNHLSGQATIMISEVTVTKTGSPDPQTAHVEMDMVFNAARTSVAVANFVPIPVKDDKGNCCVATIYLTSGNGQYDAGTGSMAISSVLLFDISNIFAADSTLPLRLTTNPPRGSVVDTTGNVVLAGTDTFPDGYLKGKTAFVTLTGQIRPHHP